MAKPSRIILLFSIGLTLPGIAARAYGAQAGSATIASSAPAAPSSVPATTDAATTAEGARPAGLERTIVVYSGKLYSASGPEASLTVTETVRLPTATESAAYDRRMAEFRLRAEAASAAPLNKLLPSLAATDLHWRSFAPELKRSEMPGLQPFMSKDLLWRDVAYELKRGETTYALRRAPKPNIFREWSRRRLYGVMECRQAGDRLAVLERDWDVVRLVVFDRIFDENGHRLLVDRDLHREQDGARAFDHTLVFAADARSVNVVLGDSTKTFYNKTITFQEGDRLLFSVSSHGPRPIVERMPPLSPSGSPIMRNHWRSALAPEGAHQLAP